MQSNGWAHLETSGVVAFDFGWWTSDGPSVGHLAALAMGITGEVNGPVRAIDLHILAPIAAGEARTSIAMTGFRGPTLLSVTFAQDIPVVVAHLYFSPGTEAEAISPEGAPAAFPPQVYAQLAFGPNAPPVTSHFRFRPAIEIDGSTPREGWDITWVEPARGDLQGRAAIATALDCWYPPNIGRVARRYLRGTDRVLTQPPRTALLNAHLSFSAPDATYEQASHLLLAGRLAGTGAGHHHEYSEIWSERGELLITAQILRREQPASTAATS